MGPADAIQVRNWGRTQSALGAYAASPFTDGYGSPVVAIRRTARWLWLEGKRCDGRGRGDERVSAERGCGAILGGRLSPIEA